MCILYCEFFFYHFCDFAKNKKHISIQKKTLQRQQRGITKQDASRLAAPSAEASEEEEEDEMIREMEESRKRNRNWDSPEQQQKRRKIWVENMEEEDMIMEDAATGFVFLFFFFTKNVCLFRFFCKKNKQK